MLKVTDEFKKAMKAPIKVLNAKAHFLSLRPKSKNLIGDCQNGTTTKMTVSNGVYHIKYQHPTNDDAFTLSGTIQEANYTTYLSPTKTLTLAKGKYALSFKKLSGKSSGVGLWLDVVRVTTEKPYTLVRRLKINANSEASMVFDIAEEDQYFVSLGYSGHNIDLDFDFVVQLEHGDKVTPYEPVGSKNLLNMNALYAKGTTQDLLSLKVHFEENESITLNGTTDGSYDYGDISILGYDYSVPTALCNEVKIWTTGKYTTPKQKIAFAVRFKQEDGNVYYGILGYLPQNGGVTRLKIEPPRPNTVKMEWIRLYAQKGTVCSDYNIKIQVGNAPIGEFEPYSGSFVQSTDNLCSLKLKATGRLFLSTAKSAQLVTIGTDYGNLQSQRVVLYVGAKVVSGNYDEVCLGSFVIHEQKVDLEKGMTTFNLLDDITLLSNIPYSASEVQFPCTVQKLIEKMSDINNFEIGTDLSKLPNASYTIKEDLWGKINGTTYRSTLDEVAGATACMVNLRDANNTIVFRNPEKVSQETLTYQNLKKVKFGGYYGKLNTVTLSRQPQEDNITVSNAEMVKVDGNKQAKLANNEILDDDREILATPILKAVEGYGFYETQIETEGHLWYEVGDRLTITDGTQSWETVVTDIDITVDGGVSEKLVCKAPAKAETNYSTTGSIYKSIWNTEIKVDKQGNQITSVVQQQNQFGDRVEDQFSKIEQDLHSITSSVQTIGGGNIIKNSVGYAKNADGKLSFWNKPIGNVKAVTSPESVSFGAISGNEIDLASGALIAQKVNVAVQEGSLYSLTAFVKKPTVGACRIRAYNEIDNFVVNIANGTELLWKKVELLGFKPSMGYLVVELENIDADAMAVTDLMLSLGDTSTAWQQAPSEILNTQVALTEDGVKVQSSVYDGDYVEITPLEFAGYSNAGGTTEKVFSLNRDTTQVKKINVENQMYLDPIKVIPIKEGAQAGLAFVKSEEA